MKDFQYEVQGYQEDCIKNIVSIFDQIKTGQGQKFSDIIAKHTSDNKYPDKISASKNIDIMMETGSGKTFVYIKTIFELNKKFNYRKFILLVPSIAIREGAFAAFGDTKNYFKSYYANAKDKEIAVYLYEAGKKEVVESYLNDENQLSCLIMTPAAFNQKDNNLNKPLQKDFFRPAKSYLELLKFLNPIVIIDEPHRLDGEAFKKYFKGFNNYYLRFGATFPQGDGEFSNAAFMLTSIAAFRENLVKQITVWTQDITPAGQTINAIKGGRNNRQVEVNNFANGKPIGTTFLTVGNTFNGKEITKINADSIILADGSKVTVDRNYSISDESLRIMIRNTIQIHFEKEADLFKEGIKALSLFFIGNISQYRDEYNPIIKKIFEDEYKKVRAKKIQKIEKAKEYAGYLEYLRKDFDADGKLQVNKGYFSGDKGNKDEQIKQGVDEILRDKRKLLSFESPSRFIFSVWALQEGWDNPNVFTICKLSNFGSEISKLQQIGRGLRICVNQNLQRQNIAAFNDNQEEFHKVNNLDIVVSSQEVGFVEAIQNEILRNSYLLNDVFKKSDLIFTIKEKTKFDPKTVYSIFKFMDDKDLIFRYAAGGDEVFSKSPSYANDMQKFMNAPAAAHPLKIKHLKAIENIFSSDIKKHVKGSNLNPKPKDDLRIKDKHYKKFKELWETINQNSIYFIDNIEPENESNLINEISKQINSLEIQQTFVRTKKTVIETARLENGSFTTQGIEPTQLQCKIDYLEFVKTLASKTKTPLSFIVKIINALSKDFKNEALKNDTAQAQNEIVEIIKRHLFCSIKANIDYCGIDGNIFHKGIMYDKETGVFKKAISKGALGKYQKHLPDNFNLKDEWIFEDFYEYDSEFEEAIILNDEKIDSIKIFGKMPKLEIDTPLGKYNPDFCYAIESKNGSKIILIVESKGYDTQQAIPQEEQNKIDFAKKFFSKVNARFSDKKIKIIYKKRINTTQLADLIAEATN
ncbi:MAG: DEAD/DEAH box helicase family protein [Elusimicrobiota bacterium]|jgi:type III restriction enzyme|nr:DEAD/DEAH box helicase family protein [Elusimicrobiota bacterium]